MAFEDKTRALPAGGQAPASRDRTRPKRANLLSSVRPGDHGSMVQPNTRYLPEDLTSVSPTSHADLQSIPGVGPSIAQDLSDLGYKTVSDLQGQDPERMYQRLMRKRGTHIDRCVLYVFRCAVYFASNESRDPELLKWWNWKDSDGKKPVRRGRLT